MKQTSKYGTSQMKTALSCNSSITRSTIACQWWAVHEIHKHTLTLVIIYTRWLKTTESLHPAASATQMCLQKMPKVRITSTTNAMRLVPRSTRAPVMFGPITTHRNTSHHTTLFHNSFLPGKINLMTIKLQKRQSKVISHRFTMKTVQSRATHCSHFTCKWSETSAAYNFLTQNSTWIADPAKIK